MKSASSRELFDYWNDRRGSRVAPSRGEIEPGAIRRVLGDSFILTLDRDCGHPFRLAGTRVCAIFGHELKGEAFARLFTGADRNNAGDLVGIVADEMIGVVAGVSASTPDGRSTELELLLLPLLAQEGMPMRILGALSPLNSPFWLGHTPAKALTLGAFRYLDTVADADRPLRLPRGSGASWLTVYQGKRL
jgi:hypothetical protein